RLARPRPAAVRRRVRPGAFRVPRAAREPERHHARSARAQTTCARMRLVSRWTCPHCDREFGRANQSHVCVPGNSVDECFATRPPYQREIFEVLMEYLDTLGPVHLDAVRVGVFLKRERTFAEVRPM